MHDILISCFTVGVKQLIVAVSKMELIGWNEELFNELVYMITEVIKKTGYPFSKVQFIPLSVMTGENIKAPHNASWYKGHSLLQALNRLEEPMRN